MASIQNRNGSFKLTFYYLGRRHYLTLGKVNEAEAQAKSVQVDYLLLRIKQKLVRVPPGVAIEEFVLHNGREPAPEAVAAASVSFARFQQLYLDTHRNGAMEADSRDRRDPPRPPGVDPRRRFPDGLALARRPAAPSRRSI